MKKVFIILLISILAFCGCSNNNEESYKSQIFSFVKNNIQVLDEYISQNTSDTTVPKELSDLNVREIEIIGTDDITVFEMYHTGLLDGGIEYGFYYTKGDAELNKTLSTNDYMVIEKIKDNWYYYEWHNG